MTPAIAATYAVAAALLAAGVALKVAEGRATKFVEASHIPLPTEDTE